MVPFVLCSSSQHFQLRTLDCFRFSAIKSGGILPPRSPRSERLIGFFVFLGFLCSCQIPRGEANLHGLLRPGTSRLRRRHRSSLQVWSQSRPLHRGNPDRDGRPSLLSIVPPRDHGIYASSDMVLDGRRRSGSVGLRQPVHILCTYEGNL